MPQEQDTGTTTGNAAIAGAETARRALRLTEIVTTAGEPVDLATVVDASGLSKPTAYRLLRVLAEEGWLDRVGRSSWRPGTRLHRLARAGATSLDPVDVARPVLHKLADATSETACLHLLDGDAALLAAGQESSAHALRRVAAIGERTPLTRGAAGIAILAQLGHASQDRLLATLTPNSRSKLRKRLTETSRRGWSESMGENHPGVAGIAAAINAGPGGPVVGSISLAGPADRWNQAARNKAVRFLTSACEEATRRLGV
jgi:IclR family transcriptional regulator, acetate operon repressor